MISQFRGGNPGQLRAPGYLACEPISSLCSNSGTDSGAFDEAKRLPIGMVRVSGASGDPTAD